GFPSEVTMNFYRYEYFGKGGGYAMGDVPYYYGRGMNSYGMMGGGMGGGPLAKNAAPGGPPMATDAALADGKFADKSALRAEGLLEQGKREAADGQSTVPNHDNDAARKNLNETAFFFPHLTSDAEGIVRVEFTMPEALTKWKFMGFAHDKT